MARLALIGLVLFLLAARALAQEPVRVMSYNIRYATAPDGENAWDKRKAFLFETIQKFDPDLLGTQETLAVQRDALANAFKGHTVFAAGRDDGKDKGEMAALYFRTDRFERLDGGHFWLGTTPEKPGSKGWDAALPRIATWVVLKDRKAPNAKPIYFLNTHFDHRGQKARHESAKQIRKSLDAVRERYRLIVTGDFNAGEGSEPYKALFGEVENVTSPVIDTLRVVHPKRQDDEGTFSGFRAASTKGDRIDWIGCSRDWTVQSAAIDRTARDGRTPSDHFAVTAVLTVVAKTSR
jgi:endonuclease/exonuclease/phosphatase family metal-dependent hydrolase